MKDKIIEIPLHFSLGFLSDDLEDLKLYTGQVQYVDCLIYLRKGKLHREDGPAIEYKLKNKLYFWLNGVAYHPEEWLEKLTPEQQTKALFNMDQWS